jgi:NADH-quinone oxidoreductase subunit J
MSAEAVLFWLFAVCIVGSALVVVTSKSPINSAMALVATFFFLAGTYVLLLAHTIAVLQVLVYAGAVMVLFLFVIMLLNLTASEAHSKATAMRVLGGSATIALLGVLVVLLRRLPDHPVPLDLARNGTFGTLRSVGNVLYTSWIFPFEAVSLLLLVAIVGAVVVAKSRI